MNDYDPYSPQNYDPAMEDDGFSASYNLPPAQDEGGGLSVRGDMAGWLEKSRKSIADIYDQAARDLQARYRGPSDKELLLAMGAAMLKPTEGGFSEALGNAISVVPEFMKQKRSYQEELGQLMARGQYDKARALASLEGRALTAMRPSSGNAVWSESLGRFVPRDQVVPTKSGSITQGPYKGGTAIQYSDGTRTVLLPNGQSLRFGPDGMPITQQGGQ